MVFLNIQLNANMPRPAIPKPGFSLLRLHSSKKPHNILNLSSQAKTDLINSIAQDIEGCIWAVGYYVKMGVLNSTHTLGFDQVINDIRGDDRRENEKILSWASNKIERYKKRARAEKRRAKKLAARLRDRKSPDYDSSSSYPEMSLMKNCFAVTLDEQSHGKPPLALNRNVTVEREISKSNDASEELEQQPMTSLPILQPPHCSADIDTSIEPVSAAVEDDRSSWISLRWTQFRNGFYYQDSTSIDIVGRVHGNPMKLTVHLVVYIFPNQTVPFVFHDYPTFLSLLYLFSQTFAKLIELRIKWSKKEGIKNNGDVWLKFSLITFLLPKQSLVPTTPPKSEIKWQKIVPMRLNLWINFFNWAMQLNYTSEDEDNKIKPNTDWKYPRIKHWSVSISVSPPLSRELNGIWSVLISGCLGTIRISLPQYGRGFFKFAR